MGHAALRCMGCHPQPEESSMTTAPICPQINTTISNCYCSWPYHTFCTGSSSESSSEYSSMRSSKSGSWFLPLPISRDAMPTKTNWMLSWAQGTTTRCRRNTRTYWNIMMALRALVFLDWQSPYDTGCRHMPKHSATTLGPKIRYPHYHGCRLRLLGGFATTGQQKINSSLIQVGG